MAYKLPPEPEKKTNEKWEMLGCGAAFYGLWFVLHLYLLFSSDSSHGGSKFFPFSTVNGDYYDLSEFAVYTLLPVVAAVWAYFYYKDEWEHL